jgi:squalene synthase HpnC
MPVGHYENFPVASLLLPRSLRRQVECLYRFARSADDFADLPGLEDSARLAHLGQYRAQLERIAGGSAASLPLFVELENIIRRQNLPIEPLLHLLDAFTQDVTTKRYATYCEVLSYCSKSANPVGRLLLHLYQASSAVNLAHSDRICTALQLINFAQDVALDWDIGRVYLPQEELARFGVSEKQIAAQRTDSNWRSLMRLQTSRARELLLEGAPLAWSLGGRIGIELRLVVCGGLAILKKIDQVSGDVFRRRPELGAADWPRLLLRSLFAGIPRPAPSEPEAASACPRY